MLRDLSRRIDCNLRMLEGLRRCLRVHGRQPRRHRRRSHGQLLRLGRHDQRRARRIRRDVLSRLCGHWRHAVWVVLIPLTRRVLLLGVERRQRGVVVGVGVHMHGRLHERAVLVLLLIVVLLLTARLFMVGNRVARAHWMVVHGDGGERAGAGRAPAGGRWCLAQSCRSREESRGGRRRRCDPHGGRSGVGSCPVQSNVRARVEATANVPCRQWRCRGRTRSAQALEMRCEASVGDNLAGDGGGVIRWWWRRRRW